jgi:hypothetical protein
VTLQIKNWMKKKTSQIMLAWLRQMVFGFAIFA